MSVFSFWLACKTTKGKTEVNVHILVFCFGLHIKRQNEKRKFDFRFSFSFLAYILNDKRKNENFREYASFFEWLLDLPEKKLYFDFLANFGHFGVFHRHKQLFTVQKCENVPKDLLESKTVCWFEVFK